MLVADAVVAHVEPEAVERTTEPAVTAVAEQETVDALETSNFEEPQVDLSPETSPFSPEPVSPGHHDNEQERPNYVSLDLDPCWFTCCRFLLFT